MKLSILLLLIVSMFIVPLQSNSAYRSPTVDEIQKEISVEAVRMILKSHKMIRRVGEIKAAKESPCAILDVYSIFKQYYGLQYFVNIDYSQCGYKDTNYDVDVSDDAHKGQVK